MSNFFEEQNLVLENQEKTIHLQAKQLEEHKEKVAELSAALCFAEKNLNISRSNIALLKRKFTENLPLLASSDSSTREAAYKTIKLLLEDN